MQHKDWSAWRSLMPMGTPSFHVSGRVQVGNPGIAASLSPLAQAQPGVLTLQLRTEQRPGIWAQVLSWKECRYDKDMSREAMAGIGQVQIFHDGALLTTIQVTDAH